MEEPQIRLHLPAHRRRTLQLQTDQPAAEAAYDRHIGAYVRYLREEAVAAGYTLEADSQDAPEAFSDPHGREGTGAAHDWLHTLPDLWNWIP